MVKPGDNDRKKLAKVGASREELKVIKKDVNAPEASKIQTISEVTRENPEKQPVDAGRGHITHEERNILVFNLPCDKIVCELMLSNDKLNDFWDQEAWEEISRRMLEEHGVNLGPNGWQVGWRSCIDEQYSKLLDLPDVHNLEVVDALHDSIDEQRRKMKARFQVYQNLYRQINAPLTLLISGINNTACVIECKSRGGKDLTAWAEDNSMQSSLLKGHEFYLPRSGKLLMESERWRLELLIAMHGGSCVFVRANITRHTLVLKTTDNEDELVEILMSFPVRIYRTSLVLESIEKGQAIDSKALQKHKWNEPSPNFAAPFRYRYQLMEEEEMRKNLLTRENSK